MKKEERVLYGLFIAAIILSLLGMLYAFTPIEAQETINTIFWQGCMEVVDASHYRLHVIYSSNGAETYAFTMGDIAGSNSGTLPYTGSALTNIPPVFTTSAGEHDDFYFDGQSSDSPYEFTLLFTNNVGTAVLPISTWEAESICAAPEATPAPAPTAPAHVPLLDAPFVNAIYSTGRVCTVHYPVIVLVCNGL